MPGGCAPRPEFRATNLRVQELSINQIKLDRRNARTHPNKQIRQLINSIVAFGFINPLLVTEDGTLIAGEGRYRAAQLLGLAKVPVIVLAGLSPARLRALAIADNKIAENAGWDRERLAIEIPELTGLLETEGLDVSILGFEAVEIDQLVTDFEDDAGDPQDSIEPKWLRSANLATCGCSAPICCSAATLARRLISLVLWRAAAPTWRSWTRRTIRASAAW
jgi:ParB-like chromosome segregation protein Spo0J